MNEKWYIDVTVVCADFQGEVNINQLVIFEMWFHVKDYQLLKRPFYNSNHKRLFICFIEIYLIVSIYLWCFGVLLFCLGLCFFVFHSCYFVYWCNLVFHFVLSDFDFAFHICCCIYNCDSAFHFCCFVNNRDNVYPVFSLINLV